MISHEIEKLLNSKGNSWMKRQPAEWKKKFTFDTTNRGLIVWINKDLRRLNFGKTNNPIKWLARELNREPSREERQMINKPLQNWSISLAIREMQINITLIFHFTLLRISIINKTNDNKIWRMCIERTLIVCCGCKVLWLLWKINVKFSQMAKKNYHMTQLYHSWARTQMAPYLTTEIFIHPCLFLFYLQ